MTRAAVNWRAGAIIVGANRRYIIGRLHSLFIILLGSYTFDLLRVRLFSFISALKLCVYIYMYLLIQTRFTSWFLDWLSRFRLVCDRFAVIYIHTYRCIIPRVSCKIRWRFDCFSDAFFIKCDCWITFVRSFMILRVYIKAKRSRLSYIYRCNIDFSPTYIRSISKTH